jgi:hypothetical protein
LKAKVWGTNLADEFFLVFFYYLRRDGLRMAGRRGSAGVKRREVKRHWGVRMKDKRES